MHLDLRMLRAFVAVEQIGSFTDAARVLRFSTPAVSAQVQALEKGCGVRLVRREGARIVLTDAGRRAAPVARLMLAAARELERLGDDVGDRSSCVKTFPTNAEDG
ncbi:MAG: LysR family transcriptional regulator [Propionibacteriales bacterium]|nr:LysR family transcriptional regulator [Propionibacteriales bacterium]